MAKKATSETQNSKPDGPQAEAFEDKTTSRIERLFEQGKLKESLDMFSEFLDCMEQQSYNMARVKSRYSWYHDQEKSQLLEREDRIELNKIKIDYQKELIDFRKDILGKYFDLKGEADFLNSINERDEVMHKLLDLRLSPKHYQRDPGWGPVEGNSSIIYRLFNPDLRRHAIAMVIKMAHIDADLKREIEQLVDLRHRNIIKLFDSEIGRFPFFVITEFVYGDNLPNALRIAGPRPAPQAADWLYQLTDALDYLRHKRILHTNVRPSKIYVDDEWQIMISPFDLIKITASKSRGKNASGSGFPIEKTFNRYLDVCQYGSPELFRSDGDLLKIDDMCVSDLYSIGLIGYKILTAEDLFSGNTLYEIIENRNKLESDSRRMKARLAQLPDCQLSHVIELLLNPKPDERLRAFPSLHALLRALSPLTRDDHHDAGLARQSYRRALANNRELFRDFYAAFNKLTASEGRCYGDFFDETTIRRQYAMLQLAVDLIIDLDKNLVRFKELVGPQNPKHAQLKLDPADYERFMNTLIGSIRESDRLHWNDSLEQAWCEVSDKAMKIIRELHGGKE